jgi:integrase
MQTIAINVNNNSLFNADRKMEFLNDMLSTKTIQEKTSTSYARIFIFTKKFEEDEKINKDLAEFTMSELEKVFFGFDANNRNTIESYGRIISSYLNWNVNKGYIENNLLESFRPSDFEKYIRNNEEYMTEKALRRYEQRCENYQDAVILRLLFEGAGGKELSEIRNLKITEVDEENKRLFLMNSGSNSGRILPVGQHTIDLINGAITQKTYKKKNGQMAETTHNNVRDYTDLVKNEYVIRASITKTDNLSSPVDKFVIYRRIDSISKSLGIDDLTAKFIQRSGMIHHAHLKMENGELSLSDLKDVAERFNIKSYHNLKGFLTTENVSKVYGRG